MTIERGKNLDDTLDILWGAIHNENDRWAAIFPDTDGITRSELVKFTGWPYSTVHRLIELLKADGRLIEKWNHQHQSYWEAQYKVKEKQP